MGLDDLLIFQTVLQEGGITRAANRLNRVQSNITTRIRQLEDDLGVALFLREGKRLIPSAAGQLLGDYAQRLLTLADEARAAVTGRQPRGQLRLGSMESTAAIHLAPVLAAFHARYPEVRLELKTGASGPLLSSLLDGDFDGVLVCGPVTDPRLQATPVYCEELVVVAEKNHPPMHSAADARAPSLLAFAPGCAYRHRLEAWLERSGVSTDRIVEMSSYHTMIGCAASGMGLALIPRRLLACLPGAQAVSIHALPPDLAQAETLLVRRHGLLAPAIDALTALLLDDSAAELAG
ncbi:MAG TPA: LysR substrate-binding domain-containing protein [Chromobacteriaceae bacterium]|nr:LysR substrate-binding domain-containing protein [Chromobacteriaceae bacterium]